MKGFVDTCAESPSNPHMGLAGVSVFFFRITHIAKLNIHP